MHKQSHPYHLVDLSPWPISTAFSLFVLAIGIVMSLHSYNFGTGILATGIGAVTLCAYCWWREVIKEGKANFHSNEVRAGLRIGMALFILSEIMFFFAFFFSYFSSYLFPVGILDGVWVIAEGVWPPKNIVPFDPWDIPLINTLILLLSGTTVTWAHYSVQNNNQEDAKTALGLSVMLGLLFSTFQAYEYHHAAFGLSDGVYAANFYLATGFHGVHVLIGTIFLAVCYFRAARGDFAQPSGHLGFEFASWYWHFVDVVWLFLFVFVYVLGR